MGCRHAREMRLGSMDQIHVVVVDELTPQLQYLLIAEPFCLHWQEIRVGV